MHTRKVNRVLRWGVLTLAPLLAIGGALVLAAAPAQSDQPSAENVLQQGRKALAKGDGIAAEMKLRAALAAGAPRRDVAALIGQALMAQNRRDLARRWLAPGDFSPATAAAGWRSLGLLERLDGNLPASGRAYDKALALIPRDASLWVEIGRLRYAGGEHTLAIDASEHALALQPDDVRALEFRGELVRDSYGLLAAIPWFESALMRDPKDVSVLLNYAATLGELGHASECVTITRRVLQLSAKNPRAFYLQAVVAARAGNYALARSLLARTKGKLDDQPGVQMLHGVVEIAAGNASAAQEALEAVLQARPDSVRARELLLRAIVMGGQFGYATTRFADEIDSASPYMLTTMARAFEVLGERQRAGELLDRAARPQPAGLRVLADAGRVGALLAQGQGEAAQSVAEAARRSDPGFYDAQALAGDVQLALGHGAQAQERYALAAVIRDPESLFLRRVAAFAVAGDLRGGSVLVNAYLAQNPTSRPALRAAANLAAVTGDLGRARAILTWLRANGGQGDVDLLVELSRVELAAGNPRAAQEAALSAYRLQLANPLAAQALGASYAALGEQPATARALLDKARAMLSNVQPAGFRQVAP